MRDGVEGAVNVYRGNIDVTSHGSLGLHKVSKLEEQMLRPPFPSVCVLHISKPIFKLVYEAIKYRCLKCFSQDADQ